MNKNKSKCKKVVNFTQGNNEVTIAVQFKIPDGLFYNEYRKFLNEFITNILEAESSVKEYDRMYSEFIKSKTENIFKEKK